MAVASHKAMSAAKEGTPLVGEHESLAHRRKRVLGLLLAVLSALIASIDPLLTRFVRLNTETDAAVIAWKYLAVGSILIVFVQATSGDTPIGLIRKLHASKAYLHLGRAALLMALHNLLWTLAVLETSIGHAIAIAALAPLWSVLIEWRLFGDRVSACTVISVVLTTSAVAMLFLNDPGGPIPGGQGKHVTGASALVSGQHVLTTIADPTELHGEETSRPPSLRGDLYALLSGFCMAAYLGACRWTDRMCPSAPMTLSPAMGSLLVCFVAGMWAIATKPESSDSGVPWVPLLTISICLGFLEALVDSRAAKVGSDAGATATAVHLLGPAARQPGPPGLTHKPAPPPIPTPTHPDLQEDISMVFATRHIPATHVAMLMNLDVIVGPLLAVAAFGEYPTMLTVVVCIIVITVLICHTAVYETGFLDDRPASDLLRFPLCVRTVNVRHGDRATKPEAATVAPSITIK